MHFILRNVKFLISSFQICTVAYMTLFYFEVLEGPENVIAFQDSTILHYSFVYPIYFTIWKQKKQITDRKSITPIN